MLLIDGSNFCFRAYHAGGHLSSRGRPTSVLHVGLSMLSALGDLVEPQPILFLWDKGPLWRREIYPDYKGNRDNQDKGKSIDRLEVYSQITLFQTVLTDIGIPQKTVAGLEGDDLAGIFTTALLKRNKPVVLVSGDKDWTQLLQPGVTQIRGWKGKTVERWDTERVIKEFGVTPKQIPNYLALIGDKSDNIPNVSRGMGPVKAIKVLNGGIKLNFEEQKNYGRNFKITRILTERPKGVDMGIIKPGRTRAGWDNLTNFLAEYELFTLYGERKRLWDIGSWGSLK